MRRSITTLATAQTKADTATLAAVFERFSTAFAKLAREPEWQKLDRGRRDKALWLHKHVAGGLRDKDPDRLARFALGLLASYPHSCSRCWADSTKHRRSQKQLATLVDNKRLDRLDLYARFEALFDTDPKKYRTILRRRRRAGTTRSRMGS